MGCDECRDELEQLRPAAEALPRAVEPVEPPPAPEGFADGDRASARRARARPLPAPRPRGALAASLGERLRRGLVPDAPGARAGALALGVVAGSAWRWAANEEARTVTAAVDQPRCRRPRAPRVQATARLATLRVPGIRARRERSTRSGSSATAVVPRPLFERGRGRRRRGRDPRRRLAAPTR